MSEMLKDFMKVERWSKDDYPFEVPFLNTGLYPKVRAWRHTEAKGKTYIYALHPPISQFRTVGYLVTFELEEDAVAFKLAFA